MKTWSLVLVSAVVSLASCLPAATSFAQVTTRQGGGRRLSFTVHVVTDKAEPVPFATVIATHHNHKHLHHADQKGSVRFSLDRDSVLLVVRSIGYLTKTVKEWVQRDTVVTVALEALPSTTRTVEVEEVLRRETAMNASGIGAQVMRAKQGQLLAEILSEASGVSLLRTGVSIAKPVVQGLTGQRIVVMNAGVKQEGQQWGNEHAPEIDPYISDSIVVVKGAAGVQYGPDAMGGVVVVEPRSPRSSPGIGGEVNLAGFSNNGMAVGSLMLEGATELGRGLLYGRVQGSGRLAGDSRAPDYLLVNTAFREQNMSAQLGFKTQGFQIDAYYSLFQTSLGIYAGAHIGSIRDLYNAIERSQPAVKGEFGYGILRPRQEIQHQLFRLNTKLNLNDNWQWRTTISTQLNNRLEYDVLRTQAANAGTTPQLDFSLQTSAVDSWLQYQQVGGLQSRYGASALYQTNVWDGRFLIPNFISQGVGLWTYHSLHFHGQTVEAGLRWDYRNMEAFFNEGGVISSSLRQWSHVAAQVGIVSHPAHHFRWSNHLGYSWRPPTVNELYSNGLHHGTASIERGDANLEAERAVKITSTATLDFDHWMVSLTGYGQYFANFIYLSPQLPAEQTIRGAFPVFRYSQLPAYLTGADLDARWQLTTTTTAQATGSMVWGWQASAANTPLLFMPAPRLNLRLTQRFWEQGPWSISGTASVLLVDRQRNAPDSLDYAPAPAAYALTALSLKLERRMADSPRVASLSIGVDNLLDVRYRDYLNRFRYYADEPGRNISIRLTLPLELWQSSTRS